MTGFGKWNRRMAALLSALMIAGTGTAGFAGTGDVAQSSGDSSAEVQAASAAVSSSAAVSASAVKVYYKRSGTYAEKQTIRYSAQVDVSRVTLKNKTIYGNLIIGKGVRNGSVTLVNCTVKGKIYIYGGGMGSVNLVSTRSNGVVVNKTGDNVRVVASGTTATGTVTMYSGGKLEEAQGIGSKYGFGRVVLSTRIADSRSVMLSGTFPALDVKGNNLFIELLKGSITRLDVATSAAGADIRLPSGTSVAAMSLNSSASLGGAGEVAAASIIENNVFLDVQGMVQIESLAVELTSDKSNVFLDSGAGVETMTFNSPSTVSGTGTIGTAIVNVNGVRIYSNLTTLSAPEGVTVERVPSGPDMISPVPAIWNQTVKGGGSVTFQSNELGYAFLVPASSSVTAIDTLVELNAIIAGSSSTMTRTMVTLENSQTIIKAPATSGIYKLVVADSAGNTSAMSTNTVVVDNSRPAATVASQWVKGGTAIMAQSTEAGHLFLVPSMTAPTSVDSLKELEILAAGSPLTFTKAAVSSANSDTSIIAPYSPGKYKAIAVDSAGNVSAMSSGTVGVDNTPPVPRVSTQTVQGGSNVIIRSSQIGYGFLVPSSSPGAAIDTLSELNALVRSSHETHTRAYIPAGKTDTKIAAPVAEGSYKLVVVDRAGNVSGMSLNVVTVDNVPVPTVSTQSVKSGSAVSIRSTEAGYAFLVPSGSAPSSVDSLSELDYLSVHSSSAHTKAVVAAANYWTTIYAPVAAGTYKLVAVDMGGNVSAMSFDTVTVENTAPSAIISTQNVRGGASVLFKSTEAGTAYLVPGGSLQSGVDTVGELDYLAGSSPSTYTKAAVARANVDTQIAAPANEGAYKLIVADNAGNVSLMSASTVTVDNVPVPTVATQSVKGGTSVLIQSNETGYAYLVPSGSSQAAVDTLSELNSLVSSYGSTHKKATISYANTNTSISTPYIAGTYKLVVVDGSGNVSPLSSSNTVTVDNTAPSSSITEQTARGGASVMFRSAEAGYAYLVPSGSTLTNIDTLSELDYLVSSSPSTHTRASVAYANTDSYISAPANQGVYKLVVADQAGNVSVMNTNVITVDNVPVPVVATQSVKGGSFVVVQSSEPGLAYLVPAGSVQTAVDTSGELDVLVSAQGATHTKAAVSAANANTNIVAPSSEGAYKLVVVDGNGNVSPLSASNTVTVDDTAPTATVSYANGGTEDVMDAGDRIAVTFSEATNKPVLGNGSFSVTGSHAFGTDAQFAWNGAGTVLTITLGAAPTIVQGDTVALASGSVITDAAANGFGTGTLFTVPAASSF